MSGTIISSGVYSTVNLDSASYTGQLTVTSTGLVSIASTNQFSGLNAIQGTTGTIINNGVIISKDFAGGGISLSTSGSIVNTGSIYGNSAGIGGVSSVLTIDNSGTISGGLYGISIGAGSILNRTGGHIYGGYFSAAAFKNGGTLVNDGTITGTGGADGIYLSNGGTIVNDGLITSGNFALYAKSGSTTLVTDTGAGFSGKVSVSSGGTNLLELASASNGGLLDMGGSFSGFGTIAFGTGAAWTLEGTSAELAAGQTIAGFTASDALFLTDFNATAASYLAGVLTLSSAASSEQITFSGLASTSFHLRSSPTGGTEITLCFCAGTRIATPHGEVAVETLRAGDPVYTANGVKPVRWIGQSHIASRFADPLKDLPIRITAGALGEGLPARDLRLSPDHAIFLGGVLVQAAALVDGLTILRETKAPAQFTYYHIELESHELLLAEGVPAESFVDHADRRHFHNWNEREMTPLPIREMDYPRVKSARQLPQALRRRAPGKAA